MLVRPGQFVEDASESDQPADAGHGRQWRLLRTHARHPAEDVGITAQLVQARDLGVSCGEIAEEVTHGSVVVTSGSGTECSTEGINSSLEDAKQGMFKSRTARATHEGFLGSGRMHCATARAY